MEKKIRKVFLYYIAFISKTNYKFINIVKTKEFFLIIENIFYNGIKSNTLREELTSDLELKLRSSYNEVTLKKDKLKIISILKDLGYYFSDVDIEISYLEDNKIDLIYNITLGEKAKIKKIIFV